VTRGIAAAGGPQHGTKYRYQLGCREECCRRANMRATKAWRAGMTASLIDATGTKRRVQALVALGWTLREISEDAGGFTKNWSHLLLKQQVITSATAEKVDATFERLSMTVPTGPYRQRTRNRAARNGWLPPLAWNDIDDPRETPDLDALDDGDLDPVVVERILSGDFRLKATAAERAEVVARWTGSRAVLGRETGWNIDRYTTKAVA
jgi:hypothetical protein